MNAPQHNPPPPAGSISPGDLLFTLFRHKWKIIFFALIGFGIAGAMYLRNKPLYESHAKILVRYVTDTKSMLDSGTQDITRSPDLRGNSVLNSEIEILASSDSIVKAVESVGAKRVLTGLGGGTNLNTAASAVAKTLQVEAGKNSSVIDVTLAHPDGQIAQTVLDRLLAIYQKKHVEIHRAGTSYDDLQAQTDTLRAKVMATEDELRTQKKNFDVVDLDQSKKDAADQISSITKSLLETETELAEKRAQLEAHAQSAGKRAEQADGANKSVATASPASATSETNAPVAMKTPTAAELALYNSLVQKLNSLRGRETELLATFTEGSTYVQQVRRQIVETEKSLNALNIDPAQLAPRNYPVAAATPVGPRLPTFDFEGANADYRSLQVKYQTLTNQLNRARMVAARLDTAEAAIKQLQRRRDLEEQQYQYYYKNLEQARLDQAIDATKLNNITVIQTPTPGTLAVNKKAMKMMLGAALGGIGFGLALAFLIDLVLDPSVKRAKDLETNLSIPVFATIPDFGRNGHSRLKLPAPTEGASSTSLAMTTDSTAWGNGEVPPWEDIDPMHPYYEALRDRIVMSYGEDSHKPKIVGLTSCSPGAGVTRLATGLAAALSRDVQRNVLLIGLEQGKVAVSAFAKGRPFDGADANGTNGSDSTESQALVQQDLQNLVATGRNRYGASIVQSFTDLMPRLKMSEYDYVIFDLPPISQTSGSIRLAAQMEKTLLIVEAEETSKDSLKKAKSLLNGSKTEVFAVLNKGRNYGPRSLNQDS